MTRKLKRDDPRHGTQAGYGQGCRCNRCKAANAEYHRVRQTTLCVVPRDFYDRVKSRADAEDKSVRALVMEAVETYL